MKRLLAVLFVSLLALVAARAAAPQLPDGLYAEFITPRGTLTAELFPTSAPLMCTNFVGLAEGTLAPRHGQPFYSGLTWYRVVPGFVLQSGNPGLKDTDDEAHPIPHHFPDEFAPGLRHDSAGVLSMANAGPDTNSCEFFLTLAPTPRLDFLHSVFGRIIRGLELLPLIRADDALTIKILRIGSAARAFRADATAFAALAGAAKKYTAARTPGPTATFDDPQNLLPAEPPRAKNFNYKLANVERATGLKIRARLFAQSPPAAADAAPGQFMRALARQLGTEHAGATVAYFADEKDWRVWIGDASTAAFLGRPATAADLGDDGAFHAAKDAFLAAAQAAGDQAYAAQKNSAPPATPPSPAQHLKLQTDALLDALITRLEPKF
jgi:cyclophilin family peptidyl-prolyl cis-trans isomerase